MKAFLKLKIHQLFHWEYWPMAVVYYPIFPVWFYLAFKARSLFFFNAANPGIKNGGMAMESKKEIYDLLPQQYYPKTILVSENRNVENILLNCQLRGIEFPLIAKPDIGMKSFAVDKISSLEDLKNYMSKMPYPFLLQELIGFPLEIGLFYVRMPNVSSGKITGIVSKEFMSVRGDGASSVLELIKKEPRSHLHLKVLMRKYGDYLHTVLAANEEFILVPYGSHTRGAKFIDITHELDQELIDRMNAICTNIPGFYFGRLDIRYSSMEEIKKGRNFSIIEINGAGSEPTHIYDPGHSLFFAWNEIIKHWNLMFRVSKMNYNTGHPYLDFKTGLEMLRANKQLEAELKLV